ncbi:MAG: DUF3788 family protein [Xanthomonadales bacterium]|nr:DUF3788 family protein [Xanthomonadales bacterium]
MEAQANLAAREDHAVQEPCLSDKTEYPDDKVLKRHLGDAKDAWDSFALFLEDNYPSYSGEWRYYNDGKSWLYKIARKTKTICWISVYRGKFTTTFYFPDRAENLIINSSLRKKYIEQFVNARRYGKTRGLTVDIRKAADLSTTKKLLAIKEDFK